MKMTKITKILSVILCLVIVAAIAVMVAGCTKKDEAPITTAPATAQAQVEEVTKLGEGEKSFNFIVKDKDEKETKFLIMTNAETLGAALTELGLIKGENGMYNTVNGITYDYTADKMYWAFYVDGNYAEKGVDETEIVEGTTYSFVATQA